MHISAYSFAIKFKSLTSSLSCSSYLKKFWPCEGNSCGGPDPSPNDRLVLTMLLLGHAAHLCGQVQKMVDLSKFVIFIVCSL
jgi:hypothetical protein